MHAIQELPWTVVRLGGTADEGAAVAAFILARQPGMPNEYQSSDCRPGGRLDLRPETASFPAGARRSSSRRLVGPGLGRPP